MRDIEREEGQATVERPRTDEPRVVRPGSRDRGDTPQEADLVPESIDMSQRSRPYGFYLILSAIVLIAVVYSVTILAISDEINTPATAIGAMTATFTVIGTLVGTYFGIKAGLDGQDKVKETVTRAVRGEARPRTRNRRED